MRVYIPVVDATPSKKAYTNKAKAKAALMRAFKKELKKRPFLSKLNQDLSSTDSVIWLDSYELVEYYIPKSGGY